WLRESSERLRLRADARMPPPSRWFGTNSSSDKRGLLPPPNQPPACRGWVNLIRAGSGRRSHRLRGPKVSPPTAAAAPHLASVATIEVIKARSDATAVPVAGDEPDAFARGPAETRGRARREPGAVDDEIAAVGGLHDLDHVLLRRQRVPVHVVLPVLPRPEGFLP